MASGQNLAEGYAAGVTPSTTNGGTETAAAAVAVGTGSSITVTTAGKIHGAKAFTFSLAGSTTDGATRITWPLADSQTSRTVLSFYYTIPAVPTVLEDVCGFRPSSGNLGTLVIGADGKFNLLDNASASVTGAKSTNQVPAGSPIRIEMSCKPGTTTSNGVLGYRYYLGDSSQFEFSVEVTSANTGTAAIVNPWIGRSTGRAGARTVIYDTVRWATMATNGTWFDPYVDLSAGGTTLIGQNTFDGLANGQVPTPGANGNTGGSSGTPCDLVTIQAGDSIVASNGGLVFDLSAAPSGPSRVIWNLANPQAGRFLVSAYFKVDDTIAATEYLMGVRNNAATAANMATLCIGSDGKLILQNTLGTGISGTRATNAYPIGQYVRTELVVAKGTTTSNGTMGYAYFIGANTQAEFSIELTTQNVGTDNAAAFFIGRSAAGAQATTYTAEHLRWAAVTSGYLAPFVTSNTVPRADLGSALTGLQPFSEVVLSGMASAATTSGASLTDFTFTQVSGPVVNLTGTGATRTYEAPGAEAGAECVFRLVVTDSNGLQSPSVEVSHKVAACNEFAVRGGVLVPLKMERVSSA